jgi:hypothetical protein
MAESLKSQTKQDPVEAFALHPAVITLMTVETNPTRIQTTKQQPWRDAKQDEQPMNVRRKINEDPSAVTTMSMSMIVRVGITVVM